MTTTLLDVPPALIAHILLPLAHSSPESIAACQLAGRALATAVQQQQLWRAICQQHTSAADAVSWNAPGWSTLWACWLRPYVLPLTGGRQRARLWSSTAYPTGQLVAIEPEPPFLVAKALHYNSVLTGPLWHPIWRAQLQPKGDDPHRVWVQVTCERAKHVGDAGASRLLAAVPGDLAAGFTLHCVGPSCNFASVELANRRVAQPYHPPAPAPAGDGAAVASPSSSADAAAGDGGAAAPLPLPDVVPSPNADLIEFMALANVGGAHHNPPLFTQLDPHRTWLGQPPLGPGAATAGGGLRRLLGLWRGSYGSHGVEVLQLCLLASRRGLFGPGESLGPSQPGGALAVDASIDAVPGVLLQQQEVEQPEQPNGQQVQPEHVLLVAQKVTGDINVPCNHVSFAVDTSSCCTAGAGEALALPPGFEADVALGQAGRRRLVVKERYRGRAQIARWGFEDAAVIAAELLVFTDSDCFGLLWKRPVESFSLFTRATGLPGP